MSLQLCRIRLSRPLHRPVPAEGVGVGGKLFAVCRRGAAHPCVVMHRVWLDGRQRLDLGSGDLVHLYRLPLGVQICKEILR